MRRLPLLGILFLLLPQVAWAEPRPMAFSVMPGGAAVMELTSGGRRQTLAESQAAGTSSYHVPLETAVVHYLVLQRPPFNEQALTVQWDERRATWERQTPSGLVPVDEQTRFDLSRTIRLRTMPADAVAEMALDASGTRVPLLRVGDAVVIPSAWRPPPLYLTRPLFSPYVLTIPQGDLDTAADVYPLDAISLQPRFGPFSYGTFDTLLLLSIGAVVAWRWRPQFQWHRRPRSAAVHPSPVVSDTPHPSRGGEARSDPWKGPLDWLTGTTVHGQTGSFVLAAQIGRGGMGAVFTAAPENGSPPVAVKILLEDRWHDPMFQERFSREVRVCSRLSHPHIVKTLDWGLVEAAYSGTVRPFLVMELLQGQTLRDVLQAGHGVPLSLPQALFWSIELLLVLEVAHQAGIIHRDVKPENVMVLDSGHVKLMDFGIARDVDQAAITKTNTAMGTPKYMSPQHFNAKSVGPAGDVYSVGIMLYEMLHGEAPYEADDVWSLVGKVLVGAAVPLGGLHPDLPPDLCDTIMRMMARDTVNRYRTAAEAVAALEAVTPGRGRLFRVIDTRGPGLLYSSGSWERQPLLLYGPK